MNPANNDQFDDPVLKSAIQRAWGDESAPADLRRRVLGLVSDEDESADAGPIPLFERSRLLRLAAAAVFVLFAVSLATQQWRQVLSPESPEQLSALSAALVSDLIAKHDACIRQGDHHHLVDVPRHDFVRIAATFEERLDFPVLVANLEDKGWNFQGAGVCRVGEFQSAHLVFSRGRQTISIFSLPESACRDGAPRVPYQQKADKYHSIAGFTREGAMFSLVGRCSDESLPVTELASLRDELK